MGEKTSAEVLQADLTYHAQFAMPSIRLITVEGGLYDRLVERLLPFGANLADLRIETAVQNLSDAAVTWWLFNFMTQVRVRAHRFEVTCTRMPEEDVLQRLIVQVLEAVKDTDTRIEVTQHGISLNLHMELVGAISPTDFLSKYVNAPPVGLGPSSGRGLVYYFPGQEERLSSSVVMEPSRVRPGALYAQGVVTFDPKRVPIGQVITAAFDYFTRVGEYFGLEVKREIARAD